MIVLSQNQLSTHAVDEQQELEEIVSKQSDSALVHAVAPGQISQCARDVIHALFSNITQTPDPSSFKLHPRDSRTKCATCLLTSNKSGFDDVL
jgi:hypothetical protein